MERHILMCVRYIDLEWISCKRGFHHKKKKDVAEDGALHPSRARGHCCPQVHAAQCQQCSLPCSQLPALLPRGEPTSKGKQENSTAFLLHASFFFHVAPSPASSAWHVCALSLPSGDGESSLGSAWCSGRQQALLLLVCHLNPIPELLLCAQHPCTDLGSGGWNAGALPAQQLEPGRIKVLIACDN